MPKKLLLIALILLVISHASVVLAMDDQEWYEAITFSGILDSRAILYDKFIPDSDVYDNNSSSDIYIYQAMVGMEAEPSKSIKGVVNFLYEQEPITALGSERTESFGLDEAYIELSALWLYSKLGRMYLPMTQLNPLSVSEPFTYTMGEMQKNAAEFGLDSEYFTLSFSWFVGAFDAENNGGMHDYLAYLGIRPLQFIPDYFLEIGGAYLSDATETTLNIGTDFFNGAGTYKDEVAAWELYLNSKLDFTDYLSLALRGEMISTMELEKDLYLDAAGDQTSISAYNAELAFVLFGFFPIGGRYEMINGVDWLGSDRYEPDPLTSDEIQATSTSRYGAYMGLESNKGFSAKVEYLRASDNENFTTDTVTLQLLLDF